MTDALRDLPVVGEGVNLAETICDHAEILGFAEGAAIIEESWPMILFRPSGG